jgi:putative tryptophan/tyrosine transport system substrate-binding protein
MRRREFITLVGGAAVAWPLAARAQQSAMPVIGYLHSASAAPFAHLVAVFREALSDSGFVEGRNVAIEYRWAEGQYDRLPALAAELVSRRISLLVTGGGDPPALAAQAATSTIPIVFGSTDPIKAGLVASLNRPGGNATGVHILTIDLEGKRFGLLHELFPGAGLFGVLLNPKRPSAAQQALEIAEAARTLGRPMVLLNASTDAELDVALATLARQQIVAMLVAGDPFLDTRRDQIIVFAAQRKLPAIYQFREYAVAGGLMSYGVSLSEAYREIGTYAARILNGAKPEDLPVIQSVKTELVINLKTAKTLGFEFPPMFSARADEVIE